MPTSLSDNFTDETSGLNQNIENNGTVEDSAKTIGIEIVWMEN